MNNQLNLSPKQINLMIWTLLSFMPLLGMIVDLIAPSLPAIAHDLHVPDSMVKNTISTFLLGYAVGNFLTGFLTDAYGRQKLLRGSLIGFTLVSIIPVLIPHINALLIARFLQGIMMGGAAILVRSILSDILPKERLVHMGAIIGIVWGFGPIVGPIIGGYLQHYFGWQACFYFFTLSSIINLIAVFIVIPETHFNRQPLRIKVIKKNILEVVSNPVFVGLPILMGISYGLIIAFHTSAPFLVQNVLHHTPIFFGNLALILGVAYLIATFSAKALLHRHSVEKIFKVSLAIFMVLIIVALIASYLIDNSIIILVAISTIMFMSTGVLFPLSMGKGLSMYSHIVGTATAIMYLINGAITSSSSFIISLFMIHNVTSIIWIYFALMTTALLVFTFLVNKK